MAISSYSNPIPEIIDGLLRGHQLGLQMQQAARADQEFKTQQAMHNQQMSMQDILNTHTMQEYGARPLGPGDTIQENIKTPSTPFASASPAPPSGQGDLYNLPTGPSPTMPGQSIDYVRKADKSRVTSLQDRFGNKTSYELPTYEEQQRRQVAAYQAQEDAKTQAQIRAMGPLAEAKARIDQQQAQQHRENMLKLYGGRAAPPEFAAIGINPGTVLTRDEWDSALQKYQGFTKPIVAPETSNIYQQDLPGMQTPGAGPAQPAAAAPGQPIAPSAPDQTTTTINVPGQTPGPTLPVGPQAQSAPATAPGGLRLLKQGNVPEPTGEFGTYVKAELLKRGYTYQDAMKNAPDVVSKVTTDYDNRKKDPIAAAQLQEMHALNMQMTQARLDDLRAKQGTGRVIYKPGDREYKVAQDLAYGKMTMQQFRSIMGYSRDVNKKMDIYDLASELNPNFNPAQFEMGFKFAANPKTQQQLASMDNVAKGADDLLRFSDAASRSGVTALNKFINPGGIALGAKKYSDFHAAQIAFADELSGALGFGGATDMSKQMGIDMTNPNLSPENFKSAVQNVVLPFIERKRRTLLDQMGTYGQPGMNPAAGPAPGGPPARGVVAPIGGKAGGGQQFSVTDPRGVVHQFANQKDADAFKQAAGIR